MKPEKSSEKINQNQSFKNNTKLFQINKLVLTEPRVHRRMSWVSQSRPAANQSDPFVFTPMRVSIVPRSGLNETQVRCLSARIARPEHAHDKGPCSVWGTPSYFPKSYAIVETKTQNPIGILYAGGPPTEIDVGWWLDSQYRSKGYASEAIDAFATHLKDKGVIGVGRILIDTYQGKYDDASCKLVRRFKAHFK